MACLVKRRERWVIDFYDQHGKRRWKTLKKGTRKKDAKDELRAIEESVSSGTYMPAKEIPTFKKVAKEWLTYKKPNVRINTWEEYERQVKKHFEDLNDLKINKINIAHIEKFIGNRQERGMNILTLRRILVVLNQVMSYAVRHRYIDHNPVREAERPRRTGNGEPEKGKIAVLDPSQIKILLGATEDSKYRTLFLLASFTGARQGELIGLKWDDIDWENSQIHIQRTFNHGRFFSPKSRTSDRRIDIGPSVLKELKKWKLECPKNEMDLLFPSESGTPLDSHHMVARHFKPALNDADLPSIRFHDMRHTYASLLIEQGENVKYIQNQLGHSSPTVTLNVYAHLMKKRNPDSALKLEKAIFQPDGSKMVAN